MYVKVTNGSVDQFPYTIGDLRRDNPNTSFPKSIPNSLLESYGVYRVTASSIPSYDPTVQTLVTNTPTENNGSWETTYTVDNRPQSVAESLIRERREKLLAATDWMALSDVTMSAEMTTYRQALRDISSQSGFPYSVTWPTDPLAPSSSSSSSESSSTAGSTLAITE